MKEVQKTAEAVQVSESTGENCNACGGLLNSWDKRCSKALAYKNPVCEKCIAAEYDMNTDDLRERLEGFFGMRPCVGI